MFFRKNKSFRPRERPKKGLKNLQTVKTLSAGQNQLNSTTIKTRKQPLTVTAQFQISLTALMDTLNQVGYSYEIFKKKIDTSLKQRISIECFSGKSIFHTMHKIKFGENSEQIRR